MLIEPITSQIRLSCHDYNVKSVKNNDADLMACKLVPLECARVDNGLTRSGLNPQII